MTRSYVLKNDYTPVVPIGDGRFYVRFCAMDKTVDDVEMTYFTEAVLDHYPTDADIATLESTELEKRRSEALRSLSEYSANELKAVSINGDDAWIASETRTSIARSIEAEKSAGATTTKMEINGVIYEMTIEKAISVLDTIEVYSKNCYIRTAEHQNAISGLVTIQEILAYDYKTGYPEKPVISIE